MSGWFGNILGQREAPPAAEVLIERLQDAHKIEDRRKTIADLKSVANNENHAIIGKAVPVLINVLKTDRADIDIIRDTLEVLIAIMTCTSGKDNTVELQTTENFVKEPNNVATVLSLLEERDYYIRYSTTQFVTTLLTNKSAGLQDAILQSPMGILRLMDLLADQRDVIRNEVLLLLLELTQTNQEIQKIVAFEGAFEQLLDIIQSEGSSDGGIIVQDCLKLINNLLRANVSNQNYFRESNCIKRVPPLLEVQNSDMWILTDNKFATLMLALDLITLLVHGSNPSSYSSQPPIDWSHKGFQPDHHKNQTVLAQNNVITLVVRLALGKMASATIRAKSLYTLGELIQGHADNLTAFAAMSMLNEATKQTQPSLLRLVLVLLNSKDLGERLSALHTFQCYLVGNEEGQRALASTVTPPPTTEDGPELPPASIGGYLLRALLGWFNSPNPDAISAWLAACVMFAILKDNSASKELLLRIPLEIPKPNSPLVTLMTKAMRALSQSDRSQTDPLIKVGLLRMLCVWLDQSPPSVKAFLASPSNLPFLVEVVLQPTPPPPSPAPHVQGLAALLIGLCFQFNEDEAGTEFNRGALHGIIMHRIGVDKYMAKLDQLRKTEDFNFAEQGGSAQDTEPAIRYYDYDFSIFFKDAYDKIQRTIRKPYQSKPVRPATIPSASPPVSSPSSTSPLLQSVPAPLQDRQSQSDAAVLASYKELVRHQESELHSLKTEQQTFTAALTQRDAELMRLHAELEAAHQAVAAAKSEAQNSSQLQQQNSNRAGQADVEEQARIIASLSQAYNQLEERLHRKDDEIATLTIQMGQLPVQQLFVEDTEGASASSLFADTEKDTLTQQVAALNEEIKQLQAKLAAKPAPSPPSVTSAPPSHLIEENRHLHEQLSQLTHHYNQLHGQHGQLLNENARIVNTLKRFNDENAQLKTQHQQQQQQLQQQQQQLQQQQQQLQQQLQQQQQQQQQQPQADTQAQQELEAQNAQLHAQLGQMHSQNTQLNGQVQNLAAQLQQTHARLTTLDAALKEKEREAGRKSPMVSADNTNLRITKLEMLLKERETKYVSLEKEQEDLLQCLANTEIENNNLKERINILEGKN